MNNGNSVKILLVEDDVGHATLIQKNLRRASISNEIIWINDGQKARDFLFCKGDFQGSVLPLPLLVLLDLNLPTLDGYQVLESLKMNEDTCKIPVVVLTTMEDPVEASKCYKMGCNVFVTKPVDYHQFSNAIKNLGLFLSIVTIPNGG